MPSGVLSTEPGDFVSYVRGGILADEMGLGKTVELLACILSNPNKDLPTPTPSERARKDLQDTLLKRKVRRLECVCGSAEEEEYEDSCVKCVICDAWQHSTCVAHKKPTEQSAGQWNEESSKTESKSKGTGAQSRCTKMRSKLRENNNDILSTGNKFVCGTCAELIARVEVEDSGATLIVCPTPILQQWQEEILRHTNPSSLRVIVYEGVGKGAKIIRSTTKGCPFLKIVSAHDLAAADIVLTTYDTLRSDLSHDADETQSVKRSLRYLKRFPVIPTPLTRLKWWRVCLDEAQMVESTTTRATEMALLLKAQNRWCVSGTPIQRGLDDIFGLLKFLQAKPFHEYQHWSQVLQQPYEAGDPWAIQFLHRFLRMFMWRLSKTDVEDELNLPKQKEDVTWLQFTPLELFYYQEQLKNCAVKSKDVISKYRKQKATSLDNADTPLPQSEAVILSRALLQLRQACCHPQVGSLKQSKPMTMDETLQDLLEEQRQTAEVHQRQLIGAWNGLAALSIIENDMSKAKSLYREALTLIDKNQAEVHVDPLQKLHILHNLAGIVNAPGSNETRTLRDDLLTKQCEEIRSKYSGSFVTKLQIEKEKYEQAQHQVFEANKACEESGGTDWWLEVLSLAEQRSDGGRELVGKIKCHFLESGNSKRGRLENASSLTHRFRDISGLKFVLQGELLAIQEKREKVTKQLKALDNMMMNLTAEYAERHANCKIHSEEKGDPCDHCLIENVFQEYENRLLLLRTLSGKADGIILAEEAIFAQNKIAAQRRIFRPNVDSTIEYNAAGRSTRDSNAIQSQVIWAPSETEEILSLIKTYAKFSGLRQRDASKKHLQMFETLRKEYGQMRKWVTSQRDFLHAFDELNMATIRLNLQVLGEKPETALEKMVKVSIEEVPFRKMELEMERDEAKKGLSNAEGAIRFLKGQSSRRRQGDPHVVNVGCASQEVANVIELDREEEEFCQICWQKFHSQEGVLSSKQKSVGHRMILLCGHLMCENCCIQLIGRTPLPANGKDEKCIPCPQCRQRTDLSKIKRVMDDSDRNNLAVQGGHFTDSSRDTEESQITVKGDYGTKITAIVRRMKLVTSKDPQVKVLIFSTWQDVLEVIGHALKENGIRSARVKGSNLQKALQEFRGLPEAKILNSRRQSSNLTLDGPIQAFLLPFNVGGNGLNLVEAQHVILVEPLPNPGVEAQAINRVHRIGQSRPTFVHRFIVSESVEQSLYEMGRKQTDISKLPPSRNWNRNPFEYTDITSVFDLFSGALADVEEGASSGGPHSLDNTRNISPTEAAGAAAEARRNANLALEVPQI
ncbi:E3 ubiquitin-protein ligase SHPRH [Marchantia polymorpha subsp. ruderalis]|uniref:RING-type domain-containing protein n=1 Tax=Marchantia polymorpha TaxID=3197 RepID=A0A2R6XDJ0_MARPO|nr:hypothetical protein MARPO_0021s0042 [Marchantia polymorpha]PTQ44167.1 hypothetical protein MARPO_0021s0042 [Marchantia polymorpha]BBN01240.1 hypothetical protein Mp_2g05860 [Marchantia polymorpha subsp. ruderalis]BBN01241.1 hypothetical protein Mp_2g05860 [Marchantia polymorpha subsp. ruderalis]|eukprot:PTQ44166.1 hypothetical protein MARPO_0021s0042 [Marchantia polymorpha]